MRELRDRRAEFRPRRHDDGALDEVLQLADISGPGVCIKRIHDIVWNPGDGFAVTAREYLEKVSGKEPDVAVALAQGRKRDRKYIQAIVQISAEPSFFHHAEDVLVLGRPH